MHREPTKCKLPLRAARSVRGSPSSSSRPEGRRCLHPGVETPAEARLRRAPAPGAGEAAANGGAGAGERAPARPGTGRGDTHRSGRAGRPHPGAPAARQGGLDGAVIERASQHAGWFHFFPSSLSEPLQSLGYFLLRWKQ